MLLDFRLLLVCVFAFSALSARGAQIVTATLTITNAPANGATLVVGSSTRTWTNSVSSRSLQIQVTNSIGASQTNLFRHLVDYGLNGPLVVGLSGTNALTLRGQVDQVLAPTVTGSWATVALSTNSAVTNAVTLRAPFDVESAAVRGFVADQIVGTINTNAATNQFSATATALGLYVTKGTTQTITGAKTFSGATVAYDLTVTNGTLRNVVVTNSAVHATSGTLTGVVITNSTVHAIGGTLDGVTLTDVDLEATAGTLDGVTLTNAEVHATSGTLEDLTITGGTLTNAAVRGATLYDSTTATGTFRWGVTANSALVNGINSGVDPGTNSFLRISSGPTSSFTIAGISGGVAGRMLVLYNATGQILTVANDSGHESTATNRIYTLAGGDITTTGSAGIILVYDGTAARWVVLSLGSVSAASTTNLWTVLGATVWPGDITNSANVKVVVNGSSISFYTTNVVTSFNGSSGAVTGVASYNGSTGAVTGPSLSADQTWSGSNVFTGPLIAPGSGAYSTRLGMLTTATDYGAMALGLSADATEFSAMAIGSSATASATNSIAIGNIAEASEAWSTAFGYGASASAEGALAIGGGAYATHTGSTAIGEYAYTENDDEIVLGTGLNTVRVPGFLHVQAVDGMDDPAARFGSSVDLDSAGVPAAPAADRLRLYVFGSGTNMVLAVMWPDGATNVVALHP